MDSDAELLLVAQERGGSYAFNPNAIHFAPSILVQAGRGTLRTLSVSSKDAGYIVFLDAADPPQNGMRPPLHERAIDAGEGIDFAFEPPLQFDRACLALFSTTPWPTLKPKASAIFEGARDE
jgi:hypothetical protein